MKTIVIHKAEPVHGHARVQGFYLDVGVGLEDHEEGCACGIAGAPLPKEFVMAADAAKLVEVLVGTLPGRTLDLLLAGLLERKASRLVVREQDVTG